MLMEERDAGVALSLQRAEKETFMGRGRQENLSRVIGLRVSLSKMLFSPFTKEKPN